MNTKVVYVAGVVLLMIGIVFYFVNSGFLPSDKPESSTSSLSTNSHPVVTTSSIPATLTKSPPLISPSAYINDSSSKTSSHIVKHSSYQLLLSLPLFSNIVDFDRQTLINALHLEQQPFQSHLSLIPTIPLVLAQSANQKAVSNYQNLTVAVKSLKVLNENNGKSLQLALDVHNPNRGSAILETLNYNVFLKNVRLASADIGTKPEGFIDSLSSVYPIIGNQTITLKDKQPLTPEGSSLFNSNGVLINNSKSNASKPQNPLSNFYIVNGTFSTTLTRGPQSQSSETPYNLQFPIK